MIIEQICSLLRQPLFLYPDYAVIRNELLTLFKYVRRQDNGHGAD